MEEEQTSSSTKQPNQTTKMKLTHTLVLGTVVHFAAALMSVSPAQACSTYTDGPMCSPIFSGNWNNGPVCNTYGVDQFGRRVCTTEYGNPNSGSASLPSSGFNNGQY